MVHPGTRARRTLGAVEFQPPRALGVIVGGAFAAWAFVAAVVAASLAIGAQAEFKTFLAWAACALAVVLGLVFANWAYGLCTLSYVIDRDALTIRWGFRRIVVPIAAIQRMVPGRTLDAATLKQTFAALLAEAKGLAPRYQAEIEQKATSIDTRSLAALIKQA